MEADRLPAEGAAVGLATNVLETLPADGMLVSADEGRQSPVPVVLIRADRALFGSQEAALFHICILLLYLLATAGNTPT